MHNHHKLPFPCNLRLQWRKTNYAYDTAKRFLNCYFLRFLHLEECSLIKVFDSISKGKQSWFGKRISVWVVQSKKSSRSSWVCQHMRNKNKTLEINHADMQTKPRDKQRSGTEWCMIRVDIFWSVPSRLICGRHAVRTLQLTTNFTKPHSLPSSLDRNPNRYSLCIWLRIVS